MIAYDSHLHSDFSTDSGEKQEKIIETAIKKGLKGLCFTDHMDLYFPIECSKKSGGDFTFDVDRYYELLTELKNRYSGKLDIRIGLEIGLRDESELRDKCISEYNEMTAKYPFDFIIGSTHCLEDIDPYWEEYWDGRTAEEGLDRYFDAIDKNVSDYDCFDSLGHLDYLVRYVSPEACMKSVETRGLDSALEDKDSAGKNRQFNPTSLKRLYGQKIYNPVDFKDYIDSILKKIIDREKALEINTAGLKYGLGFAHPKEEILERYKELGGELITVGSDAHIADHLAYDFDTVCEQLKDLGYKYYFIYKNRKPEGILL